MAGFDPDKYLQAKAAEAPAFDPDAYLQSKAVPDDSKDHYIGATKGVLFGARPAVAGLGGGIGAAAAELTREDKGLWERIKESPSAFGKGFSAERQAAQKEEQDLAQRRPWFSMGYDIGGALLTAPLIAGRALQAPSAAMRIAKSGQLGIGLGAAQAAGQANTGAEAVEMMAMGGATGLAAQAGGELISKVAKPVTNYAGDKVRKIWSNLTGVSEKEIQTYASRANEVKALMKSADGDVSIAADKVRDGIMRDVQITRQKLNSQISDALQAPQYQNVALDGAPVLQALEDAAGKASKVSAAYRPGEINHLKNLIDTTKQFVKDGKISVQDLHQVKAELQKAAQSSYDTGLRQVIFPLGEMPARAAKGAAAEAKRILDRAVPEMAKANQQLSRLHAIEDVMNKNLIKAGKPEAAILAAGSGANPRNARLLGSLDKLTGGTGVRQAENLAAGRTFGNIPLIPTDFTGKSAARMAAGFGGGYILGGNDTQSGFLGMAAASPSTLKLALATKRVAGAVAGPVAQAIGRKIPSGTIPAAAANLVTGKLSDQSAVERRMRFLENSRKK